LTNYVGWLAKRGLQGKTIANYINSIASLLSLLGCDAATDQLCRRALRGVCQMRPSKPKYAEFWDPKVVCDYLEKLGDNAQLSVEDIQDKTNALLHFAFAARSADLALIDVNKSAFVDGGIRIAFAAARKQNRPGDRAGDFLVPPVTGNRLLCPVAAVRALLEATAEWRQRDLTTADLAYLPDWNGLFLGLNKPHRKLSKDSIARRFVGLMQRAGIDTDVYGAHSARGATATKLILQGATVDEAMRIGGWSSVQVFREFYNRAVQPLNAVATVAGQRVPRPQRLGAVVLA